MNKPVYLEVSILEVSKILMHEYLHDYVKRKYGENVRSCYIDTDSFTEYKKADDIYKDIAEDVETRFDTSKYELDRPLTKGKNKNIFTEEINKIALSSSDDKRMQSIDSIETYAYGTSKDLVIEKEEIKCNSIIKRYKND